MSTAAASVVVLSVLVGSTVLLHPGRSVVGVNPASDYQIMAWSLGWWPWAAAHGANPLHTDLLWPPGGFSTLWMTTIPGPALLGLPVTLTAGPLVAYNVLVLLAVPLASAAAYLLCRELTDNTAASIVGGLLFGLSPYMLGHTLSEHLDLTFVFPLPLLALLVVRRLRGRTTGRRFVFGFALLLLLQLGASVELFIDTTLLVAVGVALGLIGGGLRRPAYLHASGLIAVAYAVCLPVLVPVAVHGLRTAHGPLRFVPQDYSTDVLNVLVPTATVLAGRLDGARHISEHFVGNVGEQDGYLGIPLVIIVLLALRAEWRRGAWLAAGLLVAAMLLSLGPTLTTNGSPVVGMPFTPARLPLLRNLLPARMSLFVSLGAAALCALWLARPQHKLIRAGTAALLVASLLPNFWPPHRLPHAWGVRDEFGWSTKHVPLGFVGGSTWKRVIPSGSNLLVIPAGDRTAALYWQVKSDMRFSLAAPATPFAPPKLAAQPIVRGLVNDQPPSLPAARLRAFLVANRIRAVVLTRHGDRLWRDAVAGATQTRPVVLNDVHAYRVPRGIAPLIVRSRAVRATEPLAMRRAHPRRQNAVEAWLRFDGRKAQLRARLRIGNRRFPAMTLSSPNGDADMDAVAVNGRDDAAVIFTERRNGRQLLKVATGRGGNWQIATLDQTTQAIWSPSVVVTAAGTTLAGWIDDTAPTRGVRAAARTPDGRWTRPITLENGDGLGTVAVGATRQDVGVFAWHDGVAKESRIRAATFDGGRWSRVTTVARSVAILDRLTLCRDASLLRWRRRSLTGNEAVQLEARRAGKRWIAANRGGSLQHEARFVRRDASCTPPR